MMRLAFLLLGARALQPQWRILALAGGLWLLLGIVMLLDLSDGRMSVVTDSLGVLLVIEGLVEVGAALALGLRRHCIGLLRGAGFFLAGFLVADIAWDNNIGSTLLFGAAFLLDGLLRIASAAVVHGPRWRTGLLAGIAEIAISILIFADHPVPHRLTVPFCLAILLLTSGYALLMMAWQLRRLPPDGSVTALPLYAVRNWHARHDLTYDEVRADPEAPGQHLLLHVWTAMGTAAGAHGQPVVNRYIAAVDRNGVISTGHSAVELPPDLYISHYPAVEIDRDGDNFRRTLHAGRQNDVPGRFQPSYQEEAAGWCPADRTIAFRRFNPAALRAFWRAYARDTTYNLTARNCSSTAILALDAAIEGVLDNGKPLRSLLHLLADPHFWLLRLVRGRAELMTWTPGLVLDYGRLLVLVTEHGERRWRTRLAEAWRARNLAAPRA